MAKGPESKVRKKVHHCLAGMGAYYFPPVTNGYGRSGVPDVVGCHRGVFFGIECKASGNTPTPLQRLELRRIGDAGGIALVIDETNVEQLVNTLTGEIARILGERHASDD